MSDPINFADLYSRHGVHGDTLASATAIANVLRLSKSQREALYALIVNGCATLDRGAVRRIEAKGMPVRNGVLVDRSDRAVMLVETFPLPNGVRVAWGAATIEQHRTRIEMLTRHVNGVLTTVGRHVAAIVEIDTAGATCLNDLLSRAS